MQVARISRGRIVYLCQSVRSGGAVCSYHGIAIHLMDAAAWGRVRTVVEDPGVVERELLGPPGADPTAGDLGALDRRLADLDRRQRNLAQRIGAEDDDDIALIYRAELKEISAQRQQLERERADVLGRRRAWELTRARL
jgi:hypothetical protein